MLLGVVCRNGQTVKGTTVKSGIARHIPLNAEVRDVQRRVISMTAQSIFIKWNVMVERSACGVYLPYELQSYCSLSKATSKNLFSLGLMTTQVLEVLY